jgi:hypothetical protein
LSREETGSKHHRGRLIYPGLSIAAISALLALWLPVVFMRQSENIGGVRYWWLVDDAMISMRYARNLADGLGLVWNAGERVEGYTNLLWTLFMTLVHLAPLPDSKTSLVVLLANVAIGAATVPLIVRLVQLLGGGAWVSAATLAAYVLGVDTFVYGTNGLEATFLGFCLVFCVCRVLEEARSGSPRVSTYLAIGAMGLVRADAAILSGLICGASLALNRDRRTVVYYCLLAFTPIWASEVFRILYYGELLPNTAYLKTMNWDGRYAAGWRYVSDFAKSYTLPGVLALVGVGLSGFRVRLVLTGVLLFYAAYVVYVGGDAWPNFRFFVPVLPVLLALAFVAVQDFPTPAPHRLVIGALCLLTVPSFVWAYPTFLSPIPIESGNTKVGLYLKENTPPDAVVAHSSAGAAFYFSGRRGLDLLGKMDPYIARQAPANDGTVPGHNKFDYAYSLGELQPDYVVANFALPASEADMAEAALGDWGYIGALYFDPTFQEHCLPNPMKGIIWLTIFACDWPSQQGDRPPESQQGAS